MKCYDNKLCVGVSQLGLDNGFVLPVNIDFNSVPHLLIVAPSGSGKTYLLKFLLQQIAQKPIKLILADFKGIDFIGFADCPNYFKHMQVAKALEYVMNELQQRMAEPKEDNQAIYFVVDEWSGFLQLYSKKEQDEFKKQMASLLMLGRGVKIFVIMALQRADSAYITGRDNFGNAIALGSLSKESVAMLFNDEKDLIYPKSRGKGFLKTDGKPLLTEIAVPCIRDMKKAEEIIRQALNISGKDKGE